MRKSDLYKILFLVGFWVLSGLFIVTFEAAATGFESTVEGMPYSFPTILALVLAVTFVGSTVVASFEVLFFGRRLRKLPFGRTLVVKAAFYLGCSLFFISLAMVSIYGAGLVRLTAGTFSQTRQMTLLK